MMRKTKKVIAVVLAIMMMLAAAPVGSITGLDIGLRSSAVQLEAPYTYCIIDGEAHITKISQLSGDVTIPATLGGYPVTEISGHGFYDITSVIIPDTVKEIGADTFRGCTKLTSIDLPENLERIWDYAFSGSGLTEIKIPAKVTYIGWFAIGGSNLERIIVDEDNTMFSSDENGVLFNKDKSTLLKYPQGSKITSYEIPDSVTYIEGWAIQGVQNLEILTIPKSVKSISDTNLGFFEFDSCKSLKRIIVDEENRYYSNDDHGALFSKKKTTLYRYPANSDATSYVVPESVVSITNDAFTECKNLVSIDIGNVTSVGQSAFSGCSELTSIVIQNCKYGMGVESFRGCNKLKDIYYAKTQEQWDKIANSDQDELQNARLHCNVENVEGHWASSSVPATCTADGETTYTCPCGFSYTEVLPATGHVDENADGKCDVCSETTDAVKNCTCNCHKSGFTGFIYKIIRIFWRLLKTNEVCACGVKH